MSESIQATCELLMIVGMVIAAVAWIDDQPTELTWIIRIAATLVSAVTLAMLLKLSLRRDVARDHLYDAFGQYFNRDGFCFQFATDVVGGVCQLHTYYQNQFDRPSVGRIALCPDFVQFSDISNLFAITLEIACGPGDFGVVILPIPVPQEFQGKLRSFKVGASVEYPLGKGTQLRFRDGNLIRANSNFGKAFHTGLIDAVQFGDSIELSAPATARLLLPTDAAAVLLGNPKPEMTVLCRADQSQA